MTSTRSNLRLAALLVAGFAATVGVARAAEPQPFSYERFNDGMSASPGVALGEPVVVEAPAEPAVQTAADRPAAAQRPATQFLADDAQLGADVGH